MFNPHLEPLQSITAVCPVNGAVPLPKRTHNNSGIGCCQNECSLLPFIINYLKREQSSFLISSSVHPVVMDICCRTVRGSRPEGDKRFLCCAEFTDTP